MSSVVLPPLPADLEYCVVARSNDSLGRRHRWQVFGALAAVSLGLALAFAAAGAWPVLAYSLLEIGVLACAFAWCERHAGDWERLTVAGDHVVVERGVGRKRERREFNRYWLRVDVEAGERRSPRVVLRGGGASWEFGYALPAGERLAVARELRALTGMR
ncbi:MAG TPA: DUF2244 domain-containing protein [Casimicrobiaceae bacterium]|nr:DUF2244 domain-containing protein [Casimicrobiaceae bacterium]